MQPQLLEMASETTGAVVRMRLSKEEGRSSRNRNGTELGWKEGRAFAFVVSRLLFYHLAPIFLSPLPAVPARSRITNHVLRIRRYSDARSFLAARTSQQEVPGKQSRCTRPGYARIRAFRAQGIRQITGARDDARSGRIHHLLA